MTKGVINLTKLVPLVGAPIGATVDGVGCRAIASYALRTFEPEEARQGMIVDAASLVEQSPEYDTSSES